MVFINFLTTVIFCLSVNVSIEEVIIKNPLIYLFLVIILIVSVILIIFVIRHLRKDFKIDSEIEEHKTLNKEEKNNKEKDY